MPLDQRSALELLTSWLGDATRGHPFGLWLPASDVRLVMRGASEDEVREATIELLEFSLQQGVLVPATLNSAGVLEAWGADDTFPSDEWCIRLRREWTAVGQPRIGQVCFFATPAEIGKHHPIEGYTAPMTPLDAELILDHWRRGIEFDDCDLAALLNELWSAFGVDDHAEVKRQSLALLERLFAAGGIVLLTSGNEARIAPGDVSDWLRLIEEQWNPAGGPWFAMRAHAHS